MKDRYSIAKVLLTSVLWLCTGVSLHIYVASSLHFDKGLEKTPASLQSWEGPEEKASMVNCPSKGLSKFFSRHAFDSKQAQLVLLKCLCIPRNKTSALLSARGFYDHL